VKITDAIHEFILYKQSLGMTYKNRALKLTAFARLAGPVEIDGISPETVRRFLFRSPSQRIRGSSGPTSTPSKKCRR